MLRIEKDCKECVTTLPVTTLRLSGRIQSDQIPIIRSQMDAGYPRKILELGEVTLVDLAAVRFLISCEDRGIGLVNCLSHGGISGPSGAAAKLGIPRQTLESKIRRLGIEKFGQKRPTS